MSDVDEALLSRAAVPAAGMTPADPLVPLCVVEVGTTARS
ncbi:hypothetical protein THTE_1372 [Thermogutta terrifontis]|uniref:Uncharacterized protein n=1 Tax=Thermogutta terrifontis TaxID=1331910 RepID=A0A286RDD5_9BACT|nr:hypothetical protein THTE_1372 [Thermogutta terrifontis]